MYEKDQQKFSSYNKEDQVIMCQIQPLKKTYNFPHHDLQQIQSAVYANATIQTLLKHIHYRFYDEGLRYTLVHKLYSTKSEDFSYYVPEFVYIAVKKKCKPMKKLLIYRASHDQSLRRLILWNVKAFTVLMKQKDFQLKKYVQKFEQQLVSSCKNRSNFKQAQKCIAMLTTASLVLKTLPKEEQKESLMQFIKRFNSQYLSDLQHEIIIPFRKQEDSKYNSNYVVRLVEDECSCFPTRKRVPYRIMFETIDHHQLVSKRPDQAFFKQKKTSKKEATDKEKQLFQQVQQRVDRTFSSQWNKEKVSQSGKYPFVVDNQQNIKTEEFMKFAKAIQEEQKQKQKVINQTGNLKRKLTRSLLKFTGIKGLGNDLTSEKQSIQGYQMNKNQSNLEKFQRTYIPTIPSQERKSLQISSNLAENRKWAKQLQQSRRRFSSKRVSSNGDVQIHEQQKNFAVRNDNFQGVWGQLLSKKINKYKKSSFFHSFKSLKMHNVVVKGGDDLRQEIICMQLIYKLKEILKGANINVFIKPYEIIVLSQNSGILQFVANSISIDGLKKETDMDLPEFFKHTFETEQKYFRAKQNFTYSLVGSSILTYVLKLKDRHNGNILLDCDGNIIHIDFGFILGMSPGGVNFESSPFKLTEQYVQLLGGKNSIQYKKFCSLFCDSMAQIRKRSSQLCLILDIMRQGSDLQCFQKFQIEGFRQRFRPDLNNQNFRQYCESLIQKSCMNSRTAKYDTFQYYSNGIQP